MSKNINVPKLRFKEFSGEWEEKKLGNIATFYNSKRIPLTDTDRVKGIYPYYGASGIIDYVHEYIFEGEYILLGEDGANIVMRNSRLVFLAKGKFWVNNHAHVFQANESNSFLCEALERINYTKYNTGTAQPKLNAEVVKKIKLNLPQKQEQEKIASFLISVDTKIEQLTKKESLLKEYKKGVMQKIFNQEIRFVSDDGSEFCDWEEKKLGEIADVSKLAGFEFTKHIEYSDTGKIIALRGLNIKNNSLVLSDVKYIDRSDFSKLSRSKLYMNDMMFTYVGTIGETAIIQENDRFYLAPNVARIRLKDELNSIIFVNHYFNRYKFRKVEIEKYIATSSQPALSMTNIRLFKLNLPCLEEQTKISNFLSSIDTKIEQTGKQLEQTKKFKKALLQQMFV